jgi:hypothetical protein
MGQWNLPPGCCQLRRLSLRVRAAFSVCGKGVKSVIGASGIGVWGVAVGIRNVPCNAEFVPSDLIHVDAIHESELNEGMYLAVVECVPVVMAQLCEAGLRGWSE